MQKSSICFADAQNDHEIGDYEICHCRLCNGLMAGEVARRRLRICAKGPARCAERESLAWGGENWAWADNLRGTWAATADASGPIRLNFGPTGIIIEQLAGPGYLDLSRLGYGVADVRLFVACARTTWRESSPFVASRTYEYKAWSFQTEGSTAFKAEMQRATRSRWYG